MIIYKVKGSTHQSCSLPINTIETTSPLHHSKIGGALISNIINQQQQQQQKRIKKSFRLTKDNKLFLQSLGFRLL